MNFFQRLFNKKEEEIFSQSTQEEINHKALYKDVIYSIENGYRVKLYRRYRKTSHSDGLFEIITLGKVNQNMLHFVSNLRRFNGVTHYHLEYIVKWEELYDFLYDWELYE